MFGFNGISVYPISAVKETIVPMVVNRNAKLKTWILSERKTDWTIAVSKKEDTWTIPS
tara:strand:- start:18218 stop:18391 length:174 start_codon:yes stop_codon:yes gene_type:complete